MQEIKCPKCGEIFQIDEAGYAEIVKQVRDKEFNGELNERLLHIKHESDQALKLAKSEAEMVLQKAQAEAEKILQEERARADKLLQSEKARADIAIAQAISEKDAKIADLKAAVESNEKDRRLAVNEALAGKEIELEKTKSEMAIEIAELKGRLENGQKDMELAIRKTSAEYEAKLTAKNAELNAKQEEVEFYKDFKARQSTKMIGEDLEKFCEDEFNKLRAAAFPNAYFEKDNAVADGTKGDYIFRESDEKGNEIFSVMFEMKNEADETSTKHKNDDFLKKLDEDRKKKNCEYAVLVSMLEPDSSLYNSGIVDKSYKFPKMYVIRPQFFIPMITILRNAAMNSLEYKRELALVRNQNIDITNFESALNDFKASAGRNYELAGKHFNRAIEDIDKTIKTLNSIKESLEKSVNNLKIASNKADDLTIKKLTRGNETMTRLFEDAAESEEIG